MALNVSGSDSLYWKTGINNAGLLAGSTQAKGILAGLSKSITRMDVFAGLAIGSALVFAKISKQAYNFSREFETAMKEVQTISKAVQNDFKGISQEIVDMSKTVPDSAQKLTKALYQIVSAGYDGAEAMDILKTSSELATASVTDTFTAADSLTYVMNAYGESAGTAADISAKLFTIVRLGKVKMEELGPTLSMVTGLAAEAGMSFNDLGAFYAEAVKKIQPHIVSTGIRGFVTALLRASKEGAEAAKAAKEMGIEFDIATLKSKGLEYMLKQMSEATEGQKQKLMELFPNVRGLIGLLAVMTNEGENFNRTLIEIENSTGATEKAFKTMVDTTENQLAILRNTVMAKLKPLGDDILGFIHQVAHDVNYALVGIGEDIQFTVADMFPDIFQNVESLREMVNIFAEQRGAIKEYAATIEELGTKIGLTDDETLKLITAQKSLEVMIPGLSSQWDNMGTTMANLAIVESEINIVREKELQTELDSIEANEERIIVENLWLENRREELEQSKKALQTNQELIKGTAEYQKAESDLIIKITENTSSIQQLEIREKLLQARRESIIMTLAGETSAQDIAIQKAIEEMEIKQQQIVILDQFSQQINQEIQDLEIVYQTSDKSREKTDQYRDALIDLYSSLIENYTEELKLVKKGTEEYNDLAEALLGVIGKKEQLIELADKEITGIDKVDRELKLLKTSYQEADKDAKYYEDTISKINEKLVLLNSKLLEHQEGTDAYSDLQQSIAEVENQLTTTTEAYNKFKEEQKERLDTKPLENIANELEEDKKKMEEVLEATSAISDSWEMLGGKIKNASIQMGQFTKESLAAAMVNTKMKFMPKIADVKEIMANMEKSFLAGELGAVNYDALEKFYQRQIDNLKKEMNDQIELYQYGFSEYQNIMKNMPTVRDGYSGGWNVRNIMPSILGMETGNTTQSFIFQPNNEYNISGGASEEDILSAINKVKDEEMFEFKRFVSSKG